MTMMGLRARVIEVPGAAKMPGLLSRDENRVCPSNVSIRAPKGVDVIISVTARCYASGMQPGGGVMS